VTLRCDALARAVAVGVLALAASAPRAQALQATDGWESSLLLRSFYDRFTPSVGLPRFGALQAAQWSARASRRLGELDIEADAALFGALKLDGSSNAGNRTLVAPDGSTSRREAWAYPAKAALAVGDEHAQVKAGLQVVNNPFLQPDETRALPPTFRGAAARLLPSRGWVLEGGDFNAVIARGHESAQGLTTSYGGTPVARFDYVGMRRDDDTLAQALFVGQAQDVWRQAFSSTSVRLGESALGTSRAKLNVYATTGAGRALQGPISTTAASLALSTGTAAMAATLGLQKVFGDQYMDYLAETNGIFLANVYGGDYNAPHEQSVQLRLRSQGGMFGLAGLDLGAWITRGWKADASAEARRHADAGDALHGLYWRNGRPAQGANRELGLRIAYRFVAGPLKDAQVLFMTMAHRQSVDYPGSVYDKMQFVFQVPFGPLRGTT
jgi:hypothetical protein